MPMTGGGVGESGVRRKLQSFKVNVIVTQKSSELPSAFLPPSPPLPPGDKWLPIPNKQKVDKKIIKKNQNETRQADAVWPPQTGNRRLEAIIDHASDTIEKRLKTRCF